MFKQLFLCHLQNCGNSKCNAKTKNFHLKGIGRGTDKGENIKGGGNNKKDRYKIPPELVKEWFVWLIGYHIPFQTLCKPA